jgi:hypothetical protein
MSYRISLYGYNRARMRSLIGSKSEDAVARLNARVETDVNYQHDPASRSECKQILTRAINEGVPFPDLVDETHIHTWAARLLAEDGQEWLCTYCDYRWESVQAFKRVAWKYARPDVRAFITALNSGSPMFGQRFAELESPYYASLTLAKITGFHEGLRDLQDEMSSRVAKDKELKGFSMFLSDLIGYLAKIKGAEMDCWYMTG